MFEIIAMYIIAGVFVTLFRLGTIVDVVLDQNDYPYWIMTPAVTLVCIVVWPYLIFAGSGRP